MHVMIDLETMGTRPNAPIVAIGAVVFGPNGITDKFYTNIDLTSAVEDGGGVIDPKTVMWWLGQDNSARVALCTDRARITPALCDFRDWLETVEVEGVWGNGASFDNVLLSEAYQRLHMTVPWEFWKDRCYRTVKSMYPHVLMKRVGTHHNALDDAMSQAQHLMDIWRHVGGR